LFSPQQQDALKEAARLMGSDEKSLSSGLLERTVATNRETVKSLANEEQAIYARDGKPFLKSE